VMLAIRDQGKVVYDGDFTGRPVSNSSTTYPNVASSVIHYALFLSRDSQHSE
jgi:hypothetical protein